jgi:hypothetical protein
MSFNCGDKVRYGGQQWTVVKVVGDGTYWLRPRGYGRTRVVPETDFQIWVTQKKEVLDRATCQICERQIGSKKGLIAHHGYTRPERWSGYQTASCWGARELPYEKSRDLVGELIKHIERDIELVKESLVKWTTADPVIEENQGTLRNPRIKVTKPDDPYYPWAKKAVIANLENRQQWLIKDLEHQKKRWNDWKAPE